MNNDLRKKIVEMVREGKDGHIPSAFSIIDVIEFLYRKVLKFKSIDPEWIKRDYFVLSKGHGCLALYVVLHRHGFLTDNDLFMFCKPDSVSIF